MKTKAPPAPSDRILDRCHASATNHCKDAYSNGKLPRFSNQSYCEDDLSATWGSLARPAWAPTSTPRLVTKSWWTCERPSQCVTSRTVNYLYRINNVVKLSSISYCLLYFYSQVLCLDKKYISGLPVTLYRFSIVSHLSTLIRVPCET